MHPPAVRKTGNGVCLRGRPLSSGSGSRALRMQLLARKSGGL
jgi:hypothetical protein